MLSGACRVPSEPCKERLLGLCMCLCVYMCSCVYIHGERGSNTDGGEGRRETETDRRGERLRDVRSSWWLFPWGLGGSFRKEPQRTRLVIDIESAHPSRHSPALARTWSCSRRESANWFPSVNMLTTQGDPPCPLSPILRAQEPGGPYGHLLDAARSGLVLRSAN